MLLNAANNAKSHVFGSVKASIILHTNSQQRRNAVYDYLLFLFKVLVLNSRLVFLRRSHSAQAFNSNYDNIP